MPDASLTVILPADRARTLRAAVESGEYASIDAALADALDAWDRRQEDRDQALSEVQAMVGASLHDPRPSLSLAEVDSHLDAFFRNAEKSRADEAA